MGGVGWGESLQWAHRGIHVQDKQLSSSDSLTEHELEGIVHA